MVILSKRRARSLCTLTPSLEKELEQHGEHWQREVDCLNDLLKQGRREEADPWFKWRKKRPNDI